MCGIVAQHGDVEPESGARMLSRLTHRGPDDEGAARVGEDAWLGHRRLSIVDVSGGKQPLETASGDLLLVGNGEVYNHEEVRETLSASRFSTDSDNEVALHLVAERGPAALEELLGMYAFVVAGEDGTFVAARDPVGIKPLYWARRDGRTVFASELGAYDEDWLADAEVFPPGHYWTSEEGLVRFRAAVPRGGVERFDGPSEPGAPIPDDMLALVRDRLIETVERQMMGDVPVGVFLSGGLDSSLVAAIAARWYRERGEKLKTFAVGLEDSSDLVAARAVAEHLGTEHHESVYTAEDALRVLPEVVRCIESFDPSLVRSAVPNYILAKFTAEHVKVVLTGEGADEIFAGYEYLEDFGTEDELQAEIVRTIEGLHNLNLQRCDRVTMAHGLEARVPFLELDMIELGLSLPAGWKLAGRGQPEKRLLRQAFDGWLPDDFLWRKKEQFGDGSGAASVLKEEMEASVTEDEFEREKGEVEPPLRTREEAAYYRIFRDHLGEVRPKLTIGRFATA
jgi:asparagine synthase (glutamine-hydrolysing)